MNLDGIEEIVKTHFPSSIQDEFFRDMRKNPKEVLVGILQLLNIDEVRKELNLDSYARGIYLGILLSYFSEKYTFDEIMHIDDKSTNRYFDLNSTFS